MQGQSFGDPNSSVVENRYQRRHSQRIGRQYTTSLRLISAGLVIIMSFWLLPPEALLAQPQTVPNLNPPAFQSTDFDPYFSQADQYQTVQGWEQMIANARTTLSASWEASVDAQINAHVATVTNTDAINDTAAYQEYLRQELEVQKSTAYAQWELAAEALIRQRRDAFIDGNEEITTTASMIDNEEYLDTAQDEVDQLDITGDPEETAEAIDRAEQEWREEFQGDLETGLAEYAAALRRMTENYDDFTNQLDTDEAQFLAKQQQLDQYEQNVRNGITQAVDGLDQYLLNSNLFYVETCDGENVCTVDTNQLNANGQDLQNLIQQLRDGLNNNDPLSTLVQSMVTYFETVRVEAQTRQTTWQSQIRDRRTETQYVDISSYITNLEWNCRAWDFSTPGCHAAAPSILFNWGALSSSAEIGGMFNYIATADTTYLDTWLATIGEYRVIEGYAGGLDTPNICSQNGQWGCWFQSSWTPPDYNWVRGANVFTNLWTHGWTCSFGNSLDCWDTFNPKSIVYITATYDWYDPNAESNAQQWQAYLDEITLTLGDWQTDLLPAIINWETQTDQFDTDYAAWQADAASKRAQAQQDYEAGTQDLLAARSKWLNDMQQEYVDGNRRFNLIKSQLEDITEQKELVDAAAQEKIKDQLKSISIAAQARNTNPDISAFTFQAPDLSVDAQERAARLAAFEADTDTLADVYNKFTESLQGAFNIGFARNIDDDIKKARQDATDYFVEVLESQNGVIAQMRAGLPEEAKRLQEELKNFSGSEADREAKEDRLRELIENDRKSRSDGNFAVRVDEQGNIRMQRSIATGRAFLKAGGNDEDANDYYRDETVQEIVLGPPPVIKAPQTGALFGAWDYQKVMQEFQNSNAAYQQQLGVQAEQASNKISLATKVARENEKAFYKDAQAQAADAKKRNSFLKSIIQSMLGGMNFGEALQSYAESEMRNNLAAAIEDATGLPAGWLTRVLNGAKPHKAAEAYAESVFWDEIEDQVGLDGAGDYLKELHDKARERSKKHDRHSGIDGALNALADSPLVRTALDYQMSGMNPQQQFTDALFEGMGVPSPNRVINDLMSKATAWGYDRLGMSDEADLVRLMDGNFSLSSYEEARATQDALDRGDYSRTSYERMHEVQERVEQQQTRRDWERMRFGKIFGNSAMGQALQNVMKTMTKPQRVPSQAEVRFRESLAEFSADSFGIPQTFAENMLAGMSLEKAVEAQFYDYVEDSVGIEGFGDYFRQWHEERMEDKKRHEAARVKPEDIALTVTSGGLGAMTYLWRNAEYNETAKLVTTAIELGVAVLVNVVPGVGQAVSAAMLTAMFTAYYAAKGAYMGSLHGGTTGAVAGGLSGAVTGLTQGAVQLDVKYDKDNGFHGSIGAGIPGGSGSNIGSAGLTFSEHYGVTGVTGSIGFGDGGFSGGLQGSYNLITGQGSYGLTAGYDGYNGVEGGLSYNPTDGFGAYANVGEDDFDWSGGLSWSENSNWDLGINGPNGLTAGFNSDSGFFAGLDPAKLLGNINSDYLSNINTILDDAGIDFTDTAFTWSDKDGLNLTGDMTGPYGFNGNFDAQNGFTGGMHYGGLNLNTGPDGMYYTIDPVDGNWNDINFEDLGFDSRSGWSGDVDMDGVGDCDLATGDCESDIEREADNLLDSWDSIVDRYEDLVETISSFDPFNPPAIDDNPFEEWKTLFPQEDADPADENQDPWTIIPDWPWDDNADSPEEVEEQTDGDVVPGDEGDDKLGQEGPRRKETEAKEDNVLDDSYRFDPPNPYEIGTLEWESWERELYKGTIREGIDELLEKQKEIKEHGVEYSYVSDSELQRLNILSSNLVQNGQSPGAIDNFKKSLLKIYGCANEETCFPPPEGEPFNKYLAQWQSWEKSMEAQKISRDVYRELLNSPEQYEYCKNYHSQIGQACLGIRQKLYNQFRERQSANSYGTGSFGLNEEYFNSIFNNMRWDHIRRDAGFLRESLSETQRNLSRLENVRWMQKAQAITIRDFMSTSIEEASKKLTAKSCAIISRWLYAKLNGLTNLSLEDYYVQLFQNGQVGDEFGVSLERPYSTDGLKRVTLQSEYLNCLSRVEGFQEVHKTTCHPDYLDYRYGLRDDAYSYAEIDVVADSDTAKHMREEASYYKKKVEEMFLRPDIKYAIARVDSNYDYSDNHFLVIFRAENGNFYSMDHTNDKWRMKPLQWEYVFNVYYPD